VTGAAQLCRMAHVWRTLPETDRTIFEAVRFDRLDYAQSAESHGCQIGDVERTIARVLLALDRAASNGQPR